MQHQDDTGKLFKLFVLRLISTVSFGFFYSTLSLLLIQKYGLTTTSSAGLVALFFGFHYTLPMIGGKIGDVVGDYKKMFLYGKCFQFASALILIYALQHPWCLYLGLGFFLADSMFNTVSLNMLITTQFDSISMHGRSKAFLNGHIWTCAGFVLAFLLSGAIYRLAEIENLLIVSALFSAITIIFTYQFINVAPTNTIRRRSKKPNRIILISLISVAVLMSFGLYAYNLTREFVVLASGLSLLYVIPKSLHGRCAEEKVKIGKFYLFMICSITFWTMYMLGPTFIPNFIDTSVNTKLLGIELPPQWLQLIGPITVVISGSLLSKFMSYLLSAYNITIGRKLNFVLAILFSSLALSILVVGMNQLEVQNLQMHFSWVVLYILLMAIGETFLAPASMALVGDLIPEQQQGLYTGICQLSTGLSVIFSGILAETLLLKLDEHTGGFLLGGLGLTVIVFGASMAILVLIKMLDNMRIKESSPEFSNISG